MAIQHIVKKDKNIKEHRKWMIRNYALAFTAFSFRFFVAASIALDYDFIYTLGTYVCPFPNLIIVEWWMKK